MPELDDPDWSEPDRYEWEVDTPIQEAGENAVDVAHFVTVHNAAELPKAKITLVGYRRDTRFTCPAPAINADGTIDLTRIEPFELVTRNCGPGMSVQSFEHGARSVMLGTVTPITARRMHLRFAFTKPANVTPQQDMLTNGLIAEIVRQVEQDIPIWEHKTYHERPMLCDGDGPIAKYRRWFQQFYDDDGFQPAVTGRTPAEYRDVAPVRQYRPMDRPRHGVTGSHRPGSCGLLAAVSRTRCKPPFAKYAKRSREPGVTARSRQGAGPGPVAIQRGLRVDQLRVGSEPVVPGVTVEEQENQQPDPPNQGDDRDEEPPAASVGVVKPAHGDGQGRQHHGDVKDRQQDAESSHLVERPSRLSIREQQKDSEDHIEEDEVPILHSPCPPPKHGVLLQGCHEPPQRSLQRQRGCTPGPGG